MSHTTFLIHLLFPQCRFVRTLHRGFKRNVIPCRLELVFITKSVLLACISPHNQFHVYRYTRRYCSTLPRSRVIVTDRFAHLTMYAGEEISRMGFWLEFWGMYRTAMFEFLVIEQGMSLWNVHTVECLMFISRRLPSVHNYSMGNFMVLISFGCMRNSPLCDTLLPTRAGIICPSHNNHRCETCQIHDYFCTTI